VGDVEPVETEMPNLTSGSPTVALMELEDVKSFALNLSPWAHMATVGADGEPDVVPVHPCWEGDTLWVMCGANSVKARNTAHQPKVALHWQVTENGDGVEIWGSASTHTDLDTKRRLWTGVFDYDLNAFAPGGPEGSPDTAFIAIRPERALVLKAYGMAGRETWQAS
jgi:general stress protein 26